MATAYLKVWVQIGRETCVREALKKIRGVKRSDLTTGEQDVIVLIESDDYQSLLDTILNSVRSVEGIERTVTNLVLE
jgi:DNA-binding Lrp family transcriptional regulator